MEPSCLKIADRVAYGPESSAGEMCPEIARVGSDGRIGIMPAGRYANMPHEATAGSLRSKQSNGGVISRASGVSLFTGAYIFAAGVALLMAPATVFNLLFDSRMIATGWIRVLGTLACTFGVNYIGAGIADRAGAGDGVRAYYRATVVGRVLLFCVFCLLVAMREVQATLLILAAANLAGAIAMHAAVRADSSRLV
eukprot:jgi/Chlat1/1621/Chrsp127S01878